MMRFWFRLAAVTRARSRRPSARGPRRVYLEVEGMEERLALSTSPVGLPGSGSSVTEMVCGYKHRGPCRPHILSAGGGTVAQLTPEVLAAASVFVGGAEGMTISISASHMAVTPPGGPLPVA
jgi:hypothetical protein